MISYNFKEINSIKCVGTYLSISWRVSIAKCAGDHHHKTLILKVLKIVVLHAK